MCKALMSWEEQKSMCLAFFPIVASTLVNIATFFFTPAMRLYACLIMSAQFFSKSFAEKILLTIEKNVGQDC